MAAFRGYTSHRGWALAKWRALRRFPSQLRSALRSWWWYWTGRAGRLEREAREWKAAAEFRFKQYVEARDLAYALRYPPTEAGGALLLAADEISLEGPNSPCEYAWQEGDTGAWNCDRERRDEVCWCLVASELRDLEKALRVAAEFNLSASVDTRPKDEDPLGASLASGAVPAEERGDAQTAPKVSRQPLSNSEGE